MEKAESLEQAARAFVKKFMHDASGPHTGSYEKDAEAWPGNGIEAEDFVKRLTELLAERERQVWAEAANECEAVMLRESEWRQADYGAQLTGVGAARELADRFRARGEQVK